MKWALLVSAIVATYPIGWLARTRPWMIQALAFLLGVLPFVGIDQLNMDVWAVPYYRGESGFEVAVMDLVALTLIFATPDRTGPIPYRFPRYLYLGMLVFSTLEAAVPVYSWFSVWQLLRAYLVFAAAVRVCDDLVLARALLHGLAAGTLYSLGIALYQRYVEGLFQVSGDLEHPNSLGMAVNLVMPIAAALVLARHGGIIGILTVVASGACVVLSLSRGSMALFCAALVVVFMGSLLRGVTRRKILFLAAVCVGGLIALAKSGDSIIERFVTAPEASMDARERFERAAAAMFRDQPWGIGMNHYPHVLEHQGYAEEFEMPPVDRDGMVHNIYWLTLVELGPHGLLAYLLLLLAPWWTALKGAWRARGDVRGDAMLGVFAGLSVAYVHGCIEWIARQTPNMYLFWALGGVAASFYRQAEIDRARRLAEDDVHSGDTEAFVPPHRWEFADEPVRPR